MSWPLLERSIARGRTSASQFGQTTGQPNAMVSPGSMTASLDASGTSAARWVTPLECRGGTRLGRPGGTAETADGRLAPPGAHHYLPAIRAYPALGLPPHRSWVVNGWSTSSASHRNVTRRSAPPLHTTALASSGSTAWPGQSASEPTDRHERSSRHPDSAGIRSAASPVAAGLLFPQPGLLSGCSGEDQAVTPTAAPRGTCGLAVARFRLGATSLASISTTHRLSPSWVSQQRVPSRPIITARWPLPSDSVTLAASSRQALTRKKEVSPSFQVSPSWMRGVTARRKLATAMPFGVKRSSGSSVRLPTTVTKVSMMPSSATPGRALGEQIHYRGWQVGITDRLTEGVHGRPVPVTSTPISHQPSGARDASLQHSRARSAHLTGW